MQNLDKKELENIRGGISGWVIAGIISGCVFIVGLFDGIARPLKCN